MGENAYRFRVGSLDCIAVRDCFEPGVVKELIPDVDDPAIAEALAHRGWPTGEIQFDFLGLHAQFGRHSIVIDPCWGPCSDTLESRFLPNLREAGVAPDEVTLVILTHLDLDHAGGVLDGRGGLAFPNARHVMAEEALTGYVSDRIQAMLTPSDAAAYREMATLLSGRTLLTQGETEVLPGVRVLPAPGHRLGHLAVELVSDGQTLLHLADTVLHPAGQGSTPSRRRSVPPGIACSTEQLRARLLSSSPTLRSQASATSAATGPAGGGSPSQTLGRVRTRVAHEGLLLEAGRSLDPLS